MSYDIACLWLGRTILAGMAGTLVVVLLTVPLYLLMEAWWRRARTIPFFARFWHAWAHINHENSDWRALDRIPKAEVVKMVAQHDDEVLRLSDDLNAAHSRCMKLEEAIRKSDAYVDHCAECVPCFLDEPNPQCGNGVSLWSERQKTREEAQYHS